MMIRKLALSLLVALILVSISGCGQTIQPGHVGILVNKFGSNRGVQDYTLKTGWVNVNPWSEWVVMYPTYIQTIKWTANPKEGGLNDSSVGDTADESITFTTDRGAAVNADVSLSFKLEEAGIPNFYTTFRSDDLSKFAYGYLHNVTRDALMEIGGHYTVEQVMGNNEPFLVDVRKRITQQLSPYGVTITQFGFIGAPRPPETIKASINAAQQAQYYALQKQNELAQAQADAAKQVATAKGEADSILARAEGQAKANHLLSESLTDKVLERARLDVQWHQIEKWNGQLPTFNMTTGDGNKTPFLLNIPTPR